MWELIGQKRAIELLEHGLETGRLAHAFLFCGPEYIGKMTAALELAMALNCESADRPCHACAPCKKIAAGSHADVQIIRLTPGDEEDSEATRIKIEQIKDIQHSANLPPFEGKRRVYIIEGAEQLSIEAANRLLKTLEEPPDNVTFILVTVNDKLLLPTVVSRCQRLEFAPLPLEELAAALVKKTGLEPERARLLAALARGCPGWAITAAGDAAILEERSFNLNRIVSIIKADSEERFAYAAQLATAFGQNRKSVIAILDLWRDYWRDMMLAKTAAERLITNIDKKDEIIKIAGGYRLAKIKDFIKSIEAAQVQLKQNVNARLALEVLMLDIPKEEVTSPA